MADMFDFCAQDRTTPRTRRLRRDDRPVERYKRAHLNWQLNPSPGTVAERVKALLAVLEAREGRS